MQLRHVGFAPDYVDYETGWAIQRQVHADRVAGQEPDTLLLLEHTAVYTAGKRTLPIERPQGGTPVIDVDRGGKITWHGPGQLVGYPIVKLGDPIDVVAYVRSLERALMAACADLGLANGTGGLDVNDNAEPHIDEIVVGVSEECRPLVRSGPLRRGIGWRDELRDDVAGGARRRGLGSRGGGRRSRGRGRGSLGSAGARSERRSRSAAAML